MADRELALIVGAGSGLSASLCRLCAAEGMAVALAARTTDKLQPLADETGATLHGCDASETTQVEALFERLASEGPGPDLVIYNPSFRTRSALVDLDPEGVRQALMITCFGGFLVGQAAAKSMLVRGGGTILFTGASASVKGYANSAPFAMGKFGLRGLAQSMARELAPHNVHVGHVVIDGGIAKLPDDPRANPGRPDALLDPDAIAQSYLHLHRQHRSAWTWEIELRPWVEKF